MCSKRTLNIVYKLNLDHNIVKDSDKINIIENQNDQSERSLLKRLTT